MEKAPCTTAKDPQSLELSKVYIYVSIIRQNTEQEWFNGRIP